MDCSSSSLRIELDIFFDFRNGQRVDRDRGDVSRQLDGRCGYEWEGGILFLQVRRPRPTTESPELKIYE